MSTGASSSEIKLGFASGSEDLIDQFVEEVDRMGGIRLPVYIVSEFQPTVACHWIPWHPFEDMATNLGRIRWHLRGKQIRFNCILLQPRQPYWPMRFAGMRVAPGKIYFFNENYGHFPLHPRGIVPMVKHLWWRAKNLYRWETSFHGRLFVYWWRLRNPQSWERPFYAWLAGRRGPLGTKALRSEPAMEPLTAGITVVIPSRQGKHLLGRVLPMIREQAESAGVKEVIVVDNGSTDGTRELADGWVRVIEERLPLSFADAVNLGIRATKTRYVCLLNNDMEIEPGFFAALERAFAEIPDLFCATAQIFFPAGQRREETGKAVWKQPEPRDFPLRCEEPQPGEDYTPVLYGSGGCSLFDTAKLREIGCVKQSYRPAYVEDLDTGWRGWQQGWPSVFVAGAKVVHHHQTTTSKYFKPSAIETAIELNYLRWILSSVGQEGAFRKLWKQAVWRLNLLAAVPEPVPIPMYALRFASFHKPYFAWDRPAVAKMSEEEILALGNGDVACFPGQARSGRPVVLVATSYLPFPLSHGGAVRMYNLMREAAKDYSLVLVSFVEEFATPAPELLALCVEVIEVKREGTHYRRSTPNPKVVDEFDSDSFRAALAWARRRWKPEVAQLEFTQMGQYAEAVRPAKSILVEHDITLDLYQQLLRDKDEYDLRLETGKWERFERDAWRKADAVVVMSEKDRATVEQARRVEVIENGVDVKRFQPAAEGTEPKRLLFIGSFAHLPNVLALAWFVNEVWPKLSGYRLHVIAGRKPEYYLDFYKERVRVDLAKEGIELEAFVSDVRPAYARATVVIAPLLASAGTNIKVLEAMAAGKAVVATPGGVNGLTLAAGEEFVLAETAVEFAGAIERLEADPAARQAIEKRARQAAVERYSWERIGAKQKALYESLRATAK